MFVKNHYIRIFVSFIFLGLSAYSQNHNSEKCLTQVPENFSEIENQNRTTFQYYLDEYYNKFASKTSTAITNVPAKIHIVTDANGVTQITEDEIMDEIDEANSFLANSFLEITVCEDVNYIANNQLYFFDIDDQGLLYANNQPDIMNIYFVESIAFGNGNACGYTYLPGNSSQYYDVIVMDNQCTTNEISHTLVHEFGHHFNLLHTHGVSNVELTDELVNGTNCLGAGDRICDTPADPQLGNSNVSSVNCLYTGNETDALGQIFEPDTSNIMSYSPNTCIDSFSQDQYARMYAGFHTFKTYYSCPSFNVNFEYEKILNCDDTMTVNFSDLSVGANSWEWDVDGDDIIDYTDQNPSHNYDQPGTYDVSLTITNNESEITKVFPQVLSFDTSNYDTSSVSLKLFIVDPNENTWELKNGSGEILYSGGPYAEMNEYNYEFDINENDCYSFIIYDSAGNGLGNTSWTVGGGEEFYELKTNDGTLITFNNNFGYEELTLINNAYMSTTDSELNNQITLYPNPSSNVLKINYKNIIPDSFSIFDINGRTIKTKPIIDESDLIIDVSSYEKGLYFISIKSSEKVNNLKFLVK